MAARIALFGGSFNPPGLHHRRIVEALARRFDKVLVVPCGPRPDKAVTNLLPPVFRAAMADMTFSGVDKVQVDLFDLEQQTFTRSHELEQRYAALGDVWHVVGVDIVKGGRYGDSEIHRVWAQGERLWREARFAVLTRPGHAFDRGDLPPNSVAIEVQVPGSSTEIRDALQHGREVDHLLTPRTFSYIQRYGLYRAPTPGSWAHGTLAGLPHEVITDGRNPKAVDWSGRFTSSANPQFITVLGGDGAMLRAIREHWHRRLPFYGINAGHIGFLMNAAEIVFEKAYPPEKVVFRQLPMLYVQVEDMDGRWHSCYGFNDAWMERDSSQSAWVRVGINDKLRLRKLVGDGVLVATAAGSTAYARAMGASPLLADTPAWLLVGSNVMEPLEWKSALLSADSTVDMEVLEPEHRPLRAFVDGQDLGLARRMKARLSHVASVELMFDSDHDVAEKIAELQFRHTGLSPSL